MMKKMMVLGISIMSSFGASVLAADHFKVMHVKDLSALMEAGKSAPIVPIIYDVNVESTRSHVGIIPGAKLLSSSSGYDVRKELPADKSSKLVFYCANTRCTASHTAAEKAISSGYTDVSVMVDGIYGWKDAGKTLEKVVSKPQAMAPKEVQALVSKNEAMIVDVREGEERHIVIDQAQWMPMSKSEDPKAWAEFRDKLPKDKLVVFHCAAGVRAKKAAEKLSVDGFKTAYFESPDQWKSAGLSVKEGPAN